MNKDRGTRKQNSTPLRITLVLGHQLPFPPEEGGGVNNLLWSLSKEFARRGNLVTAISPKAVCGSTKELESNGIIHRRIRGDRLRRNRWLNNIWGIPYSTRVYRVIGDADVTSFHAPFSFLIRKRRGLGVATHSLHRTPKWIFHLYAGMDRIYAGSHATRAEACKVAPYLRRKIKTIHNCIDCSRSPQRKVSCNKDVKFVYVGRFARDKGLESLVLGALDARVRGCNVSITTVGPQLDSDGGDSKFFGEMRRLVGDRNSSEAFTFLPSINCRERLFELLARFDVFCLPSLSGETFSMAGLEAMSCGLPLLASDYAPVAEMVEDQITGYLAKAGDACAWSAAIQELWRRRDDLARMGLRSYEKVQREFSVEIVADQYLEDFRQLVEARRRAASSV